MKKSETKKERSLFLRIFDIRMLFYDFGKWTAALFLWLWLRTKRIFISGKKPKGFSKGKFIIATNHVSFSDFFVVSSALPFRRVCCVSTDHIAKGAWGWFFKAMGTIFINKEKVALKTFKDVKKTFYRGHLVCMFPEGSISNESELRTFKGGIAMMAATSEVDILPIYVAQRKGLQRKVAVIGERIKHEDLFKSSFPTKDELNHASEILLEKEKELESLYKEKYLKH